MADLSGLSIDQLRALDVRLKALIAAGKVLKAAGWSPRFDITPGKPVRIITYMALPPLFSEQEPAPPVLLPEVVAEAPAAVIPDAAGAPDPVPSYGAQVAAYVERIGRAPDPDAPMITHFQPVDPIEAHLRRLGWPGPWGLSADLDLMEDACAGLDVATIAIRLECPPKAVKARFEQLTNSRAFGREAVRDALRRLAAPPKVLP